MNYEIVNLNETTAVGYCARTNNASPEMGQVIGGLWQRLYSPEGCQNIPDKIDDKALGIYTEYDNDEKGDYTVMAACRTKGVVIPEGFDIRKIPAGRYAKFVIRGNMITAVAQFWQELWQMKLDRSYICDFEEYQNSDPENAEIHIYIGLK